MLSSRKAIAFFRRVQQIFETEWSTVGFEDEYQEGEYKKDGGQIAAFSSSCTGAAVARAELEKTFELPVENNVILKGASTRSIRWDGTTWRS